MNNKFVSYRVRRTGGKPIGWYISRKKLDIVNEITRTSLFPSFLGTVREKNKLFHMAVAYKKQKYLEAFWKPVVIE